MTGDTKTMDKNRRPIFLRRGPMENLATALIAFTLVRRHGDVAHHG